MIQTQHKPVIIGYTKEKVNAIDSFQSQQSQLFPKTLDFPLKEKILIPPAYRDSNAQFFGVPDDNRSIIFPDMTFEFDKKVFALSIKGVGARSPLYGTSPLDYAFSTDFGTDTNNPDEKPLTTMKSRLLTNEAWFGEAPYGAQGEVSAKSALEITNLLHNGNINGFYICPVIEINEFPQAIIEHAMQSFWYRRYQGKYFQEIRLVPSNIRMYHQSELTLGQSPAGVLKSFDINTCDDLDMFIDHYISSGIAALTVYARTLRKGVYGLEGLDYSDVWLDKDSVIAPDGTIYFADVEGLDWVVNGTYTNLESRIRKQFDRNYYEFMFGLDVLFRERMHLAHKHWSINDFRSTFAIRLELALNNDPFITCESSSTGVDLIIHPHIDNSEDIRIRIIDLK